MLSVSDHRVSRETTIYTYYFIARTIMDYLSVYIRFLYTAAELLVKFVYCVLELLCDFLLISDYSLNNA